MRKLSYMVLISIITSLSLLATDRILTSGGKVVAYNGKPVISKDYTPTDADNVVAWYDANDTNTITELAGAVSGWADKSGNTNDAVQSTGADQPSTGTHTINGLNTIEFNDDYLQNTTSLTNVRAIFFVSDIIEGAGISTKVAPVIGEVSNLQSHIFVRANKTDYSISVDGNMGATGSASVSGGIPVAGGNIDLGLSIAEKKLPLIWYAEWDANHNWDYIGRLEGNGEYKLIGAIGELIVLDAVPSVATRQKLEGYLAWKFGLEGNLPTGHPYKGHRP